MFIKLILIVFTTIQYQLKRPYRIFLMALFIFKSLILKILSANYCGCLIIIAYINIQKSYLHDI